MPESTPEHAALEHAATKNGEFLKRFGRSGKLLMRFDEPGIGSPTEPASLTIGCNRSFCNRSGTKHAIVRNRVAGMQVEENKSAQHWLVRYADE